MYLSFLPFGGRFSRLTRKSVVRGHHRPYASPRQGARRSVRDGPKNSVEPSCGAAIGHRPDDREMLGTRRARSCATLVLTLALARTCAAAGFDAEEVAADDAGGLLV